MSGDIRKLKLSANHRRVVSVRLRSLEKMCGEICDWLDKKPGILSHPRDDLKAEQKAKLRALAEQVHKELRRLEGEVDLAAEDQSATRAVQALLSAGLMDVEEAHSRHLKAYGQVPPGVKEKLDPELDRLMVLLEEMMEVIRKK